MKAILTNVLIRDLLDVLNKLAIDYKAVDITIDPDDKRITIIPIEDGSDKLTDDNIYTLI